MTTFQQTPGQTGGAAITNDQWHIEIYAHPQQGLTLEIRMAATGVPAAIAHITKSTKGYKVGPWKYGELQRLPPTLVLERARQFAQDAIV